MNRFQSFIDRRPDYEREYYQKRLDAWDEPTLLLAIDMAGKLESYGCIEPEGWVFSELNEKIPQSARFALLKTIWERAIEPAVENDFWVQDQEAQDILSKVKGMLLPEEKKKLFRVFAKTLGFEILNAIDEGCYNDNLPGWVVIELGIDEKQTGRELSGLHESIFDDDFQRKST